MKNNNSEMFPIESEWREILAQTQLNSGEQCYDDAHLTQLVEKKQDHTEYYPMMLHIVTCAHCSHRMNLLREYAQPAKRKGNIFRLAFGYGAAFVVLVALAWGLVYFRGQSSNPQMSAQNSQPIVTSNEPTKNIGAVPPSNQTQPPANSANNIAQNTNVNNQSPVNNNIISIASAEPVLAISGNLKGEKRSTQGSVSEPAITFTLSGMNSAYVKFYIMKDDPDSGAKLVLWGYPTGNAREVQAGQEIKIHPDIQLSSMADCHVAVVLCAYPFSSVEQFQLSQNLDNEAKALLSNLSKFEPGKGDVISANSWKLISYPWPNTQ